MTVNHVVIEGLATTGQGPKPLFCWEQVEMGMLASARGLAEGRIALPALVGGEEKHQLLSRTGLALVMGSVMSRCDTSVWPGSGPARVATAAMEIGAAASRLVDEFFFHEHLVAMFLQELETLLQIARETDAPNRIDEAVTSLVFASCARAVLVQLGRPAGEAHGVLDDILMAFSGDAELAPLASRLEIELPRCHCSEEYGRLALSLFPAAADQKSSGSTQAPPTPSVPSGAGGSEDTRSEPVNDGSGSVAQPDMVPSESPAGAATATSSESDGPGSGTDNADAAGAPEWAGDKEAGTADADGVPSGTTSEVDAGSTVSPARIAVQETASAASGPELPGTAPAEAVVVAETIGTPAESSDLAAPAQGVLVTGVAGAIGLAEVGSGSQDLSYSADGRLIAALMRSLQEQRPAPVALSPGGARVSTRHFWRLDAVGDVRVFKTPALDPGVDVAVQVLLDRSSSMKDILEDASRISLALGDALRRITGVRSALAVFPGANAIAQPLLHFNGNLSSARAALRSLTASGGTPLGGAMKELLPVISALPVRQKFLVVISDGEPGDEILTRSMLRQYDALGIEVLGIGLGAQSLPLKRYIHRSAIVSGVRELPGAIELVFKQHVLKKAA
jgi:hypothetical protein